MAYFYFNSNPQGLALKHAMKLKALVD